MLDKLIDLIITSLKLFRLFVIIHEFEAAVVLRFGCFKRVATRGICWVIPFDVDEVYFAPTMIQTILIGPQSLVSRDGREIVTGCLVTWQVDDPQKFILVIQGGEQVIEDTAYGVVARVVMESTWDELTHSDINKELTLRMRQKADGYGVKVRAAQITDLTRSRSIRLMTTPTIHHAQGGHYA